ncbi:hypothetical protein N4T77_00140 [Clostridium sp. CX1]|uniref:hypothetical protein n=1 Tax=Clostridium sp. CX1 TaxID=2978346 RepID=UPI0021C152BC|nr:hypothetical protein [Clostridium sp. CX1]MCT8974997.1 hypothetical protein [Clostridium sp. CX1]
MGNQEITEMIQDLERKEANKEKLTVCELTILDLNNGAKKENRELTDREIEFIKFWME